MIPSQITALLSASYALQLSGVYTCISILPERADYADVQRALNKWCHEHTATIQVVEEPHGVMQYCMVDRRNIARIHVPAQVEQVDTVVVEVAL